MKKKFVLPTFVILLLFACQSRHKEMVINGTAPENRSGEYIYLFDSETPKLIDSVQITEGSFTFKTAMEAPQNYRLSASFADVAFIAENGTLTVALEEYQPAYVRGSALNDELTAILEKENEILTKYRADFDALMDDLRLYTLERDAKKDSLDADVIEKLKANFNEDYAKHSNDVIGAYLLIKNMPIFSDEEFAELLQATGADVKNNPYVTNVVGKVAVDRKGGTRIPPLNNTVIKMIDYAKTTVGSPFADFTGIDPQNPSESISFSDFVGKGNCVLAHVWASYCSPCLAEAPFLKRVYQKYQPKGLVILTVGANDELDAFVKSVKDKGIVWPQIFDRYKDLNRIYGIGGFPHTVLYDKEGVVIARELYGENIEKKIAEIYAQ